MCSFIHINVKLKEYNNFKMDFFFKGGGGCFMIIVLSAFHVVLYIAHVLIGISYG